MVIFWKSWLYQGSEFLRHLFVLTLKQNHISRRQPADGWYQESHFFLKISQVGGKQPLNDKMHILWWVNNVQEHGNRALLGAIAAFFDRFAGSNLMGTLCFSMGPVSRPGESYLRLELIGKVQCGNFFWNIFQWPRLLWWSYWSRQWHVALRSGNFDQGWREFSFPSLSGWWNPGLATLFGGERTNPRSSCQEVAFFPSFLPALSTEIRLLLHMFSACRHLWIIHQKLPAFWPHCSSVGRLPDCFAQLKSLLENCDSTSFRDILSQGPSGTFFAIFLKIIDRIYTYIYMLHIYHYIYIKL